MIRFPLPLPTLFCILALTVAHLEAEVVIDTGNSMEVGEIQEEIIISGSEYPNPLSDTPEVRTGTLEVEPFSSMELPPFEVMTSVELTGSTQAPADVVGISLRTLPDGNRFGWYNAWDENVDSLSYNLVIFRKDFWIGDVSDDARFGAESKITLEVAERGGSFRSKDFALVVVADGTFYHSAGFEGTGKLEIDDLEVMRWHEFDPSAPLFDEPRLDAEPADGTFGGDLVNLTAIGIMSRMVKDQIEDDQTHAERMNVTFTNFVVDLGTQPGSATPSSASSKPVQ